MSVLELVNVSKRYSGSAEVVEAARNVSMSISAGEVVILFGPSGAGKSTLLLLAAGVLKPDEGRVLHNGRDPNDLSESELADRLRDDVGIAYQHSTLLPGHDTLSNVAVKLLSAPTSLREARRQALPWLAKVGLGSRLGHRPDQLSGGERQRVALARALVGNPSLLLLDEPTARLDSQRGSEILDLISGVAKEGTGVLLVTHDRSAVRIADKVLELRDGQLERYRHERAA